MKPTVKVFTKANPCNKMDIWNCFVGDRGVPDLKVQVDEAHGVIGVNVPRVMERSGRLVKNKEKGGDFYSLTPTGRLWLLNGVRVYMKNHPAEARRARVTPRDRQPATPTRTIRIRKTATRITRRRPT